MQGLLEEENERLQDYIDLFKKTGFEQLRFKGEQLKGVVGKIESLNPLAVLTRGYSVALKEGRTVKSAKEVSLGEEMEVRFADGKVKTTIIEKEN